MFKPLLGKTAGAQMKTCYSAKQRMDIYVAGLAVHLMTTFKYAYTQLTHLHTGSVHTVTLDSQCVLNRLYADNKYIYKITVNSHSKHRCKLYK